MCVVLQINCWPLSDYPMFAPPKKIENTYGFSLFYIPQDKQPIAIPINGGATIMHIYSQSIKNKDVLSLKKQISEDVKKFLFTQKIEYKIKDRIILKKVGLKRNHDQISIYTIGDILEIPAPDFRRSHE